MRRTFFMIRNVTLLDGTGQEPVSDQTVVVEGQRIAWVGPTEHAPAVAEEAIVDGSGHTLMPGLINCHVHLCSDGAPDLMAQVLADTVPLATLRGARAALLSLQSGVTTVRDCGAASGIAIELAKAIELGQIPGPRVKAAGRVITMTGGHGHFMGREADGRDAVRTATRAEIKGGAHFIKVMSTGGVLTPGVAPTQTALLPEELDVVAQEAHNAGRRVATHAIGNAGIKNALRAGIDSIEHGFYLDDEALDLAVAKGAFLVPTLLAIRQIIQNGVEGGIPTWVVEKAEKEAQQQRESFKAAVKSGMKIAAGTDAGTPFNRHDDMAMEMALMVDYGLSPMQAILAATRNAAENLDVLHSVGTIEVGKLADLILIAGQPTENIDAMRRVAFVTKGGAIHRNDLGSPQASLSRPNRL